MKLATTPIGSCFHQVLTVYIFFPNQGSTSITNLFQQHFLQNHLKSTYRERRFSIFVLFYAGSSPRVKIGRSLFARHARMTPDRFHMLGTERLVEFDNCVSSKVKVERTLISYTSIFRFDSIAFCEQQTRLFLHQRMDLSAFGKKFKLWKQLSLICFEEFRCF